MILNRRDAATVIAGLRLLASDGVRVANHPHVLVAGLCDETEPEYELRFDADEDYLRELIDRIDEMSLRGAKLCNRCTEKAPSEVRRKTQRHVIEEFTMTIGDTTCAEEGAHEESMPLSCFGRMTLCNGDLNCNGHIPWSSFTRWLSCRSHEDAPACS